MGRVLVPKMSRNEKTGKLACCHFIFSDHDVQFYSFYFPWQKFTDPFCHMIFILSRAAGHRMVNSLLLVLF